VTDIRLEVVVGAASPPAVTLRAGEPRDVFSVGFEGSWSVAAEGIAAVHAYFVFDGTELFVASADAARPAMMGGAAVPVEWVPVPVPGDILLGRGVLRTGAPLSRGQAAPPPPRRADDRERTQQVERTMALAPPPAPPRERSTNDPSRTRIAPVEALHGQQGAAPQGFAPAPAPAPALAPSGFRPGVPAFWLQASIPKKITYVLLPFALLATLYVLLADDEAAPHRAAAPPASSSSAPIAVVSAPPPPATTSAQAPVASAPHPVSTDRAPRPATPPGRRTPDREIVDLIAAGSYADAARKLDDLAAAQPDHPEYREAARILRAKAGARSP
jgi:hypothetical protein